MGSENRPLPNSKQATVGFLKQNLMGIGGLRTHIGIVPICGTFLPVDFGSSLHPPKLGPHLLDVALSLVARNTAWRPRYFPATGGRTRPLANANQAINREPSLNL
jgi:hypothetical protein